MIYGAGWPAVTPDNWWPTTPIGVMYSVSPPPWVQPGFVHADVTSWGRFPHYCSFVKGIYRSPPALDCLFNDLFKVTTTKTLKPITGPLWEKLNKRSKRRWWETPSWSSCDFAVNDGWELWLGENEPASDKETAGMPTSRSMSSVCFMKVKRYPCENPTWKIFMLRFNYNQINMVVAGDLMNIFRAFAHIMIT